MTQTVYIESTIPSFYHEVRDEPEMVAHIRRVNSMLGLFTPALATPLELLGEDDNEG